MQHLFSWRNLLLLLACLIIATTVVYVNNLVKQMQAEEKRRIEEWVAAYQELQKASPNDNLNLELKIITNNTTIPVIAVNNKGQIIDSRNLDSTKIAHDPDYLVRQLNLFKSQHPPILEHYDPAHPEAVNYFYYGDSILLKQIRYYPYVQLTVIALFLLIVFMAISSSNRSSQNQLWVGLARETAHQLGTPLSSLQAWVEMLKEHPAQMASLATEIQKDVERLNLIAERFSKIGSEPEFEETDLIALVQNVMLYMRKRASQKIQFVLHTQDETEMIALVSPTLFSWVIENLLKNALDATEGQGSIEINMYNQPTQWWIDIRDSGKGIPKHLWNKIFKPGFTTKKRGWGLGLSLAKRIVETYHKGKLILKSSEPGKGSTFRIILYK
ncbi:MAG: HAMP domain-containing histidine kinase [Thermoflavifilum sp.]|uniref:sensor histidine kinase n=1 Tax=Thermoflavifilum sp. TaxID=1968839 RepID=UPI0018A5D634|nr:HAMP domain-containing sensor histidine kinase [Thermoflavifilum sp.]QOR76390.1 MAG: HAMP domain-containing histidine kinase [Thermoflavifilum sp.]